MMNAKKPTHFHSARTRDFGSFQKERVLIICDFDGTACKEDMGSKVFDRFVGEGWRDVDRAYCTEEIGSRIAYTKMAPLFRGTKEQMVEYVHSNAVLDPYFADFYLFCEERGYNLKIASDGLDFYIETVLRKYGLADIEFFCNSVTCWHSEGISIDFPYLNDLCQRCGTCKSNIVRGFYDCYDKIIYVGDSYSDVCPSGTADIVFAKYILYEKCRQNGTDCIYYNDFRDIIDCLKNCSSATAA
jgi:2,3-diketo-5-methylthio-1-phosphopentane phosphatase